MDRSTPTPAVRVDASSARILAIDPGNEQSAWVLYDTQRQIPLIWTKAPNSEVLAVVEHYACSELQRAGLLAVESIASYGMAVGATVFETCVWVGRFIERWLLSGPAGLAADPLRVYRREVKSHLCGTQRAKDTNIRQAIIDRYGPGREVAVGRKATPGPLYGMKADCWQALAVAITVAERDHQPEQAAA